MEHNIKIKREEGEIKRFSGNEGKIQREIYREKGEKKKGERKGMKEL